MRLLAGLLFSLLLVFSGNTHSYPKSALDYGVFCVRGHLMLDQRRIEELKTAYGEDVCCLDRDGTEDGAKAKVERLGGVGAPCTCP